MRFNATHQFLLHALLYRRHVDVLLFHQGAADGRLVQTVEHLHHLPHGAVKQTQDLGGRQVQVLLYLIHRLVLQPQRQQDRLHRGGVMNFIYYKY